VSVVSYNLVIGQSVGVDTRQQITSADTDVGVDELTRTDHFMARLEQGEVIEKVVRRHVVLVHQLHELEVALDAGSEGLP